MCLYADETATELTAKEDIVCFKYLKKKKTSEGVRYKSSRGSYQLGKTLRLREKLSPLNVNTFQIVKKQNVSLVRIDKGFHSYDVRGALCARAFHLECLTLYECIIPKGAKYYKGYHNTGTMTGYVSTSLKVIKEMKL